MKRLSGWFGALLVVALVLASVAGCAGSSEGGAGAAAPQMEGVYQVEASAAGEMKDEPEAESGEAEGSSQGETKAEISSEAENGIEKSGEAETEAKESSQAAETSAAETEKAGKAKDSEPKQSTAAAETGKQEHDTEKESDASLTVEENGTYTSKEEVALYLHLYGKLPSNYITKKEAEDLGWKKAQGEAGQLHVVAPGKSIGGSRFGNYEGLLPDKKGRKYFECDINYVKGNRGAERIIYSNDGLIYYTSDHYKTFEKLYPEE